MRLGWMMPGEGELGYPNSVFRKAGIVIEGPRCPLLIVAGTADTQWPRSRYDDLHVAADHVSVEGASHWGLVLNRRVLPGIVSSVIGWLEKNASRGSP